MIEISYISPKRCSLIAGHFLTKSLTNITLTLVLIMIIVSLGAPACVAIEHDGGMPKEFRTGFLQCTLKDIDIRDAQTVLELDAKETARYMELNIPVKVIIFENVADMINAVHIGKLEVFAMPAIQYLGIRDKGDVIPAFVNADNKGYGIKYLLITRKNSGMRSISDLRGKSLLVPPNCFYEPGHLWLDVLLMKEGKEGKGDFFSSVRIVPKTSTATVEVFFRQADAALITRSAFDVSVQLNPQLGKELAVLAESPNLLNEIVCMSSKSSESFRNRLANAMTHFNESKTGQQLFTIFKNEGITPFELSYLGELEKLLLERKALDKTGK